MPEQHESTKNPLYSEELLRLQRNDDHFAERKEALHHVDVHNSVCGDKYKLYFDYDHGVNRPSFAGYGCALSKASNALLMEHIQGLTWSQLSQLCQQALDYFAGESDDLPDEDPRFSVFLPVRDYPGRKKCVTHGWQELGAFARTHERQ